MSSQRGNVSRSRGQKYQNTSAFKNDKYGATAQVKKANAKIHNGLCQHCKSVLEWKVKYNKYKSLTQPKKCVKCSQKSVKDAYHIICKPCSTQLEICCKCGKKEDIVIPINPTADVTEEDEEEGGGPRKSKAGRRKKKDEEEDDWDSDEDFQDDEDDNEDCNEEPSDSARLKTQNKPEPLPDMSRVKITK